MITNIFDLEERAKIINKSLPYGYRAVAFQSVTDMPILPDHIYIEKTRSKRTVARLIPQDDGTLKAQFEDPIETILATSNP